MTEAATPTIERLAAAVVSTARGVRGHALYAGWTAEGLPAAAASSQALAPPARKALAACRGARLLPRKVPFSTIVPVTYVLTGAAIDFADTPQRRAEDQISYTVLDAAGQRREVALGELGVLWAITTAREPWQDLVSGRSAEAAVSAIALYTLFAPIPGIDPQTGMAMLFDPTLPGGTNAPAFRSFVRHTIGRLLILDESLPPQARKGYMEVAGRLAGLPPRGGLLQALVWLRQTGFVEFDDAWLRGLQRTGRHAQGGLLRLLRALGMVEVSDDLLHELADVRPDYDIDRLDMDRLVDLAAEMHAAATRALR
jgi:hypothetical protein